MERTAADSADFATTPLVHLAGAGHGDTAASDAGTRAAEARPVATQLASATARHHGDGTIEITLSPQELGRVRMVIHHQGPAMSVAIQADRPETLDLMRRHADVLVQEFRAQGYSGTAFAFSGGGAGAQGHPPAPLPLPDLTGAAAEVAPSPAPAMARARPTADGLDLRL